MREQRRVGCSRVGRLVTQNLGHAAQRSLTTGPKQILVGSVLNERVFKAIV